MTVVFTDTQSGSAGNWSGVGQRTVIQIAALAASSGSQIVVKFSVQSGTAAGAVLTQAWVGESGGANEYDFDGNQVQLKFSGATSLTMAGGAQSFTSDAVNFSYTNTKKLVIAFDWAGGSTVNCATQANANVNGYYIYPVGAGGFTADVTSGTVSGGPAGTQNNPFITEIDIVGGAHYSMSANTVVFTSSPSAVSPKTARKISLASPAYNFSPNAIARVLTRRMRLASASFTFSPNAATLKTLFHRALTAATAAFAFTPSGATLTVTSPRRHLTLSADTATFHFAPSAVSPKTSRRLSAATAAFVFSPSAITPKTSRRLSAAKAIFTFAPSGATLTKATPSHHFTLSADTATFHFAPSSATFVNSGAVPFIPATPIMGGSGATSLPGKKMPLFYGVSNYTIVFIIVIIFIISVIFVASAKKPRGRRKPGIKIGRST